VRPAVDALQQDAFIYLTHNDSIFFIASGVGLSPLYYGHFWPIVPAPDDR
jgi:hypothetical protein